MMCDAELWKANDFISKRAVIIIFCEYQDQQQVRS